MLLYLITFCSLCFLSVPAFATEADFEKHMARGVSALDAGTPVMAQEEFRAALIEHPDDQEAALYLAIALNWAADPAAEETLKTALRRDPGNPRINFELGTLYYKRGMFDEAGDYFEAIQALSPDDDMKAAADNYLANIRSAGDTKRWGVTFVGGMQYDSNVPLAEAGGKPPVGITRRGDWRGVINLGLTGVAYRDGQQEVRAGYSLYQTLHIYLDEFDLTQHQFDLSYKGQISPTMWFKLSGGMESVQINGKPFVESYTATPGLLAVFQEGMMTQLDYRIRTSAFKNSSLYPTNSERNGMSHAALLSHSQRLSELLTLRVGYTFEREFAEVDAWSALSHQGSAGLAVSLTNTLLLDVSTEVTGKRYDEIQSGATEIRSDTTLTGAVSFTWQMLKQVGIAVGYHHTANSSNISGYDYTRGITSVLFQGRY